MASSLTLCRICLEAGANLPLFENVAEDENSFLNKLNYCLNETVTEVEGYPKHICTPCSKLLEDAYRFIKSFKNTSTILQNNFLVKLEQIDDTDENLNEFEIEFEPKDVKHESSDDELLSSIKIENSIKKESKPKAKRKKLQLRKKKSNLCTNKIASSILEGEFFWIGDTWCIKPKQPIVPIKKEKPPTASKQKRVQIKIPKIKIKKEATPTPKLCDICGMIFMRQDRLALHKRKAHNQTPIKCTECPQVLCSDYYLQRHLKRCHFGEKKFMCATCGSGFCFKGELQGHIRNVHEKHLRPPKKYHCKLCDKEFKCQKSVVIHERSAHTGDRPAVCTICESSFFHEDYLKEHMRLHTGETPFKCPVCGRGYAQRCNMKSHLRIHRKSEVDPNVLSKLKPNYLRLLKP